MLLNRRGFATVIFCRQCGASLECPHCSVSLTYHRAQRRVRCHYCNYAAPVPRKCGVCGGEFLEQSGFGTERLEADLARGFPERGSPASIATPSAAAARSPRVLRAVARGDIDIVVGTQMIAKGHDFPAVTLVGVVSADVGLGLADFRAAERTFQLLTQVVGRAGRGDVPGRGDRPDAVSGSLRGAGRPPRRTTRASTSARWSSGPSLHYPPAVALINVIVKARTRDGALADAHDLVRARAVITRTARSWARRRRRCQD